MRTLKPETASKRDQVFVALGACTAAMMAMDHALELIGDVESTGCLEALDGDQLGATKALFDTFRAMIAAGAAVMPEVEEP